MTDLVSALGRALASLVHPRMFSLMIWPIALALVFWSVLAIFFGAGVLGAVQGYLGSFELYQQFTSSPPWSTIATGLLWILGFLLFIPLVLITASLIIGVISMPMMVRHIAARDFPSLEQRRGGSVAGSVGNAFAALGWLALLAVVTAPLWVIPVFWPVLPIVLFGYFNQRLFRYDALAEHASAEEIRTIFKRERGRLWLLGIILAVIGHIPVIGFFMPVLGGLAFIYFLLGRLAQDRSSTARMVVP